VAARSWLLLVYKVPPEPTARRVYVWRKLKRLGAILLHDAVWVLPQTAYTREQLQWLASEIAEMDGDALVWEAQLALPGEDKRLVEQFTAQVEKGYKEILGELQKPEADLAALSRRYQQIKATDYFQSELGQQVREALVTAGGEAES
jgi:DNA-binding transcriptional regulator PaaX